LRRSFRSWTTETNERWRRSTGPSARHTTREFQQIKVRMFRFAGAEAGFTVFGIEANWPESLTVNAYVTGADVDPAPGLGFTCWKTGDGLALLRWMPEYNRVRRICGI